MVPLLVSSLNENTIILLSHMISIWFYSSYFSCDVVGLLFITTIFLGPAWNAFWSWHIFRYFHAFVLCSFRGSGWNDVYLGMFSGKSRSPSETVVFDFSTGPDDSMTVVCSVTNGSKRCDCYNCIYQCFVFVLESELKVCINYCWR